VTAPPNLVMLRTQLLALRSCNSNGGIPWWIIVSYLIVFQS
jgi:hypothetical protein